MVGDTPHRLTEKVIDALIERADIQGHLTIDDLMEIFPVDSLDVENLRSVIVYLHKQGIDILDQDSLNQAIEDPVFELHRKDLDGVNSDDSVGLYLKEMSGVPLLSMEEEQAIAKRIELGRSSRRELMDLKIHKSGERMEVLRQFVHDGEQAWEHLIKANTRLVVSVAKKYIGRGLPFLDLIQEGNLGLIKAVEKFDYTRGFRFSTYATWWIRQSISRSIADHGRIIRIPVHMIDRIRELYKVSHDLEQKLGHKPTSKQIAEVM